MNQRMDRNRLNIGTYCLAPYAVSETHIRELKDCGIDFVIGAPLEKTVLDRFESCGVGLIASGVLPGWWGGDGTNAGKMEQTNPMEAYERAARDFKDHPAIWGIDTGDEPSALDFPYYGRVIEFSEKHFQNQFAYLNIYPNYASLAGYSSDQVIGQLGTETYQAYVDAYVKNVPTDYICYDHYLYSCDNKLAYENLRIIAEACRRSDRSMWIVLQVNSSYEDRWISYRMLCHQAYTAMAFGAEVITWACYTAGWWHNQVLDEKGCKTQQYEKLSKMNAILHKISDNYMKYRTTDTYFVNFHEPMNPGAGNVSSDSMPDNLCFFDLTSEEPVIVGRMEPRDGSWGEALFIASASDPFDQNPGSFRIYLTPCTEGTLSVYINGEKIPVHTSQSGEISFRIERNGGALVCLK